MTDVRGRVERRPWTPGEDALAADRSVTAAEVAVRLGRTAAAVTQRRQGLARPSFFALGLDPGGTTGLAVVEATRERRLVLGATANLRPTEVRARLETELDRLPPGADAAIACERYAVLPGTVRKSPQPDALHVTGVARDVAAARRVPLLFQSPADAKRLASDDLLRRLGWYDELPGDHARDAARQALRAVAVLRAGVVEVMLPPGSMVP